MDVTIVVSLVAGAFTAIMSFLVAYRQRLIKQKEDIRQKELSNSLNQALSESFKEYLTKSDTAKTDYFITYLRNYLVHYSTVRPKQDIESQANEKVDELKKRIEAIEKRFPQEATLEKIASVNDAIMATQLEAMSDSTKTLQDKMLTKWDVAKIVFAILSALGILTGLILGILNLIK